MEVIEVIKRNGKNVPFLADKIQKRIENISKDLKVEPLKVFFSVCSGISSGMSTKQIDELIAETSATLTTYHPHYSILASRIAISRHHKETESDFFKIMKKLNKEGIIRDELLKKYPSKEEQSLIQEKINFDNDFKFNYFGWKSFEEIYLLRDKDNNVVERIQHLYMRTAIMLSKNLDHCFEIFENLYNKLSCKASPIYINSGTKSGNMVSCELHDVVDDSTDGLLETINRLARSSRNASGLGLSGHKIRSKKSSLSTGGKAGGVLKYSKILNETMKFWNQGGKRPGAVAIYLEMWHKDIFDLLDIRKPTGDENKRARDIFTAVWVCDLFMKRLTDKKSWWTLFCPKDIERLGLKPLQEIYGDEFEAQYLLLEEMMLEGKIEGVIINPQDLWLKVLESQIETGTPYILYKDHINKKSNQKNIGTITSSNLCAEIVQYHDSETIATCILSSIVVQNFLKDGKMDWNLLQKVVHSEIYSLNHLIETNVYANPQSKKGAEEQRALALGIQGLADLFAILNLSFTSDEARKLNKDIHEHLYYYALEASCKYAQEYDCVYKYFEGSPISQGIFQFDMWDNVTTTLDWEILRKDIMKFGVANSLVVGDMPTASSARTIGSNECFEAFNSNLSTRRVKGGQFVVVNDYLISDLDKLELWNEEMRMKLISEKGSVQNIDFKKLLMNLNYSEIDSETIEKQLKEKFRTIFEIRQKDLVEMALDRSPFIDQTQSLNIFIKEPNEKNLTSCYYYSWKNGMKTAVYYLRTKPNTNGSEHLALNIKETELSEINEESNEIGCIGCNV